MYGWIFLAPLILLNNISLLSSLIYRNEALSKTGNKGCEQAMEWLLAHADELESGSSSQSSATPVTQNTEGASQTEDKSEASTADGAEAKSIKCEDCGKLFQTQVEIEFHAAKSGHSNFSESTEEKKPLTEEEKAEKLKKVEDMLKQKRREREEKEKLEALEREKNRIKAGKEMIEAKKRLEDAEMKKILEQRKRDKEEERLARQRVRDQIEADKAARKAKFAAPGENVPAPEEPKAAPTVVKAPPTKNYNETRLQIRLTNGQALTQTFGIKEPLSAVRVFVELNRTDGDAPFTFMTTFPKKIFKPEDNDLPLDSLGLVPSAVLIVTKTIPV
ncbi:UBX domain-containing protein 1-B-like [Diaphorina citri]|uniref:UBX domain-containing protein 1-B-like n=1 Tax=Diaphorina citri TaxID=121845 RepID=A0A1S4ECK4_DIACI|nr:UBX domain-containing protein 1-B-like [Diaphorina citri]